jgi:hypothetical protein
MNKTEIMILIVGIAVGIVGTYWFGPKNVICVQGPVNLDGQAL